MSVRRIVGILAPFLLLMATAAPAWAHPGIDNPYVPVGRPATVVLDVPAEEQAPMVGVDITLPADFQLLRLDQTPNWRSSSGPGVLHFNGGPVAQGGFVQFTFSGIFAKKAVLLLPVTVHGADGSERHWDGKPTDPFPATYAFPGYPVGKAPIPGLAATSTSSGRSLLLWAGRILVVGGAVTLITLFVLRRRSVRQRAGRVARRPRNAS
jgi:uncharacterized protein YcnI